MALGVGRVGWRSYVAPPPTSTLYNNLIHAWNANGNANDSVGSLNGTLINGALANAAPKMGSGAFYFDRINDYISLQDNSLNLDTDFTVSFWCKDGYGGINRMIIHNCYFANDAYTSGWMILYGGNGIEVDIWNNGAYASLTTTADSFAPYRTNWNHVTVKYTRGVKIEIFLNGVLNSTKNTTLLPSYTRTPIKTSIGSWNSLYSPTLYLGDGLLDDLNIWNRALTNSEITELYNFTTELAVAPATTSISTNGLALNLDAGNTLSYPGTGTTWTDLSGNGRNGTLINGVGYSSSNGGYLTFNGVGQDVRLSNIGVLLNAVTNFSIDMWFKIANPSTGAFYSLFSYGWSSNYSADILIYQTANKIGVQVNNGADGGGEIAYTSTGFANVQVVYNGTLTGNSNRLKIYINGVEQTATFGYTVPAITSTVAGGQNAIASYSTPSYNNFLLGNVSVNRIYNRSLTSTEVATNFDALKSRYGL
jgi:hypothetical protein